ncbi:MAG: Rieske (2Fe-2S) protein [Gaiellales bacterium]
MSEWHDVAAEADVTPGAPAIARIEGREIGVMRDPRTNALIAIRNRCPHSGAKLCLGTVEQRIEGDRTGDYHWVDRSVVVCPWHGWEFDTATGECPEDEAYRVAVYPVRVEGGRVLVQA